MPQKEKPGDDLLSRTVASTVPLALQGLTTLFGMGRGVAPAVMTPGILKEGFGDSRIQESSGFTQHLPLDPGTPPEEMADLRSYPAAFGMHRLQVKKMGSQAVRPISITWLNALLRLHR